MRTREYISKERLSTKSQQLQKAWYLARYCTTFVVFQTSIVTDNPIQHQTDYSSLRMNITSRIYADSIESRERLRSRRNYRHIDLTWLITTRRHNRYTNQSYHAVHIRDIIKTANCPNYITCRLRKPISFKSLLVEPGNLPIRLFMHVFDWCMSSL